MIPLNKEMFALTIDAVTARKNRIVFWLIKEKDLLRFYKFKIFFVDKVTPFTGCKSMSSKKIDSEDWTS